MRTRNLLLKLLTFRHFILFRIRYSVAHASPLGLLYRSAPRSFADETSWKIPFGLLSLFTFIAFILACVGVSTRGLSVGMIISPSARPAPDSDLGSTVGMAAPSLT